MKLTFSIHEYDSDGDILDEGLFIHCEGIRIKIGDYLDSIDDLINQLQKIKKEILENYNWR